MSNYKVELPNHPRHKKTYEVEPSDATTSSARKLHNTSLLRSSSVSNSKQKQTIQAIKIVLHCLLSISVVLGILVSPLAAAFGLDKGRNILIFCDVVWFLSFCVYLTVYISNKFKLIKDTDSTTTSTTSHSTEQIQYILLGLLLCIPWDLLCMITSSKDTAVGTTVNTAVDTTKLNSSILIRVAICFRLFRSYRLDGFVQPFVWMQSKIFRITCHQPVIRLMKIMLFIATFSHVCACLYILAGSSETVSPETVGSNNVTFSTANANTNTNANTNMNMNININSTSSSNNNTFVASSTWIKHYVLEGNIQIIDVIDVYLRALHMSVQTLLTVGFGDAPPLSTVGNLLMLMLAFTGAVTYALMIASLTSIVKNVAAVSNSKQSIKEMEHYLHLQGAPIEFQKKMTRYLRQMGRKFGGMNEKDIYNNCLSPEMQTNIIYRDAEIMYTLPLFQSFGMDFCHELAQTTRRETFMVGEMLIKQQEFCSEIIIIVNGTAVGWHDEETENQNQYKQHYEQGSAIGIYNTLFRGTHATSDSTVRVTTVCDVLIVTQNHIQQILMQSKYQSIQSTIRWIKKSNENANANANENENENENEINVAIHEALIQMIQRHKKNTKKRTKVNQYIQTDSSQMFKPEELQHESKSQTNSIVDGVDLEAPSIKPRRSSIDKKSSFSEAQKIKEKEEKIKATKKKQKKETLEDIILIVVVLWSVFIVPYRAAQTYVQFNESNESDVSNESNASNDIVFLSWVFDYICDIFFIFRFFIKNKRLHTEKRKNSLAYRLYRYSGGFIKKNSSNNIKIQAQAKDKLCDELFQVVLLILTVFPYDIIYLIEGNWFMWTMIRLFRLLTIFYFFEFLRSVLRILKLFLGIEHLSSREEVLMTIAAAVVLTVHWLSCAFQTVHSDNSYIRAVYWSLVSISTTGFGELVPQNNIEFIFSLFTMYFGATIFAGLIACLASMQSARITPHNAKYRTQVLTQLCESMLVSNSVTNNVLKYDMYRTNTVGNCDEIKLINNMMPNHYKIDLFLQLHLNVVQNSLLFSKCSIQFQQIIVENVTTCFVSQGESIVTLNDSCPGMYFMIEGKAHIDELHNNQFLPNDCFGQESLFELPFSINSNSNQHNQINKKVYKVTALEDCTLLLLTKNKMSKIMETLPELYNVLSDTVENMDVTNTTNVKTKTKDEACQVELKNTETQKIFQYINTLAPIVLGIYIYLLPFQAAFLIHWELSYSSIGFDCLAYVILIGDVIVSWKQNKKGKKEKKEEEKEEEKKEEKEGKKKEKKEKKTIHQYLWIVDIFALLPWEIFTSFITSNTIGPLQAYAILHFPKLILLLHYDRYIQSLNSILTFIQNKCNDQFYTLGGLVMLFSTCGHVLACIWFALSIQSTLIVQSTWATSYNGLSGGNDSNHGNHGLLNACLPAMNYTSSNGSNFNTINVGSFSSNNINNNLISLCEGRPVSNTIMQTWYVASIYYISIALTTVGYGDIVAVNDREYLFTICVIVLGTFILIYVLAKLEKIVANIDVASTLANRKAEVLHEYIQLRNLPVKLELKINEYIELVWKQRCGATFKESMNYLGTRQRVQIIMEKIKPILKTIPVFKKYPENILYLLAEHFQPEILLPHQILFEAEEISDKFYILIEGEIELLEPPPIQSIQQMQQQQEQFEKTKKRKRKRRRHKETIMMTLEGPCAVCMETFFIKEPRPCTARSSKGCTLFSLSHVDLIKCLKTDVNGWKDQQNRKIEIEDELKKMSLVKTMKKNLSSAKLKKMQEMTNSMNGPRTTNVRVMFPPHSTFRQIWAVCMVMAVLLDFLALPARLAFVKTMEYQFYFIIIGMLLDLFHVVNIYLKLCRFSVLNEDGIIISEVSKLIKLQFKSTSFYFHLLASLPIQLIIYYILIDNQWNEFDYLSLTLSRIPKLFILFQSGSGEIINILEKWGVKIDSGFFRTFKMGLAVLVATHYVACLFLCVTSWQNIHTIDGIYIKDTTNKNKYIAAAYWSAYTISTVGYGNVNLQEPVLLIYAMGTSLLGTVLCGAGLTALLTYWIDGVDQMSGLTHLKQKCVDLYLNKYTYTMQQRIECKKYLSYMSSNQKSIDEKYALSLLPNKLSGEILCHFTMNPIRTLLASRSWSSNGLLRSLCLGMQPYVSSTMEELIVAGKVATKMYVLIQGKIQNIDASGNVLDIKNKFAFGGDFKMVSKCSYMSVNISHLFYITNTHYNNILKFNNSSRRSTRFCSFQLNVAMSEKSDHSKDELVQKLAAGVAAYGAG